MVYLESGETILSGTADPDGKKPEKFPCIPEGTPAINLLVLGAKGRRWAVIGPPVDPSIKNGERDGMVSVSRFVDGWRDHGAEIGVYQGGRIEWEKPKGKADYE
jgi:hypothetical protein